jgi:hypothetical protein
MVSGPSPRRLLHPSGQDFHLRFPEKEEGRMRKSRFAAEQIVYALWQVKSGSSSAKADVAANERVPAMKARATLTPARVAGRGLICRF